MKVCKYVCTCVCKCRRTEILIDFRLIKFEITCFSKMWSKQEKWSESSLVLTLSQYFNSPHTQKKIIKSLHTYSNFEDNNNSLELKSYLVLLLYANESNAKMWCKNGFSMQINLINFACRCLLHKKTNKFLVILVHL